MTFSRFHATFSLLFALVACTSGLSLSAQTTLFKLATVSPDGSASMQDLRSTLKEIEDQTGGRVSFRIYAGGVMGDDTAVLRKMRVGQLQGGFLQTGAFEKLSDSIGLYNLPMIFNDFDEVSAVRTKLDSQIISKFEHRTIKVLGFVGLGFANAMSKHSATSVPGAQGLKVWSPKGDDGARRLLQSFGITPTPLSVIDVLTGLQTGLIDTVAGPPVQLISLQWHTQVKYRLDLPFMYIYSVFAIDKRKFNGLTESDQELVEQSILALLSRAEQQNYQDHERSLFALNSQGIQTLTPSPDELVVWRDSATQAATKWVSDGHLDNDLVLALNEEIDSYRSQSAQ